MIPNIFHFINIGPREFNMMHFMSVYSAYILNKPKKIYVYVDHEQKDNVYWELLKSVDVLEYEFVTVSDSYEGHLLTSYQYKADIIRMQKLIERGGIYMDLDVLSLKPLTKFLEHKIVLGSEMSDDRSSTDVNQFKSITNAVLMTESNNDFMKFWYRNVGDNLVDKPWAYHAVTLPQILLKQLSDTDIYLFNSVHLEPSKTFMPFCFRDPFIWDPLQIDRLTELDESYTVHLWETIWSKDYVSKLNLEYFNNSKCILTQLFKQSIDMLYMQTTVDKIKIIIKNSIANNNKDKVSEYVAMLRSINKKLIK